MVPGARRRERVWGHHRDRRHGHEVLGGAAAAINRLGALRWSGLGKSARANYRWRLEGKTLRVLAFESTLLVEPPPEAASVAIDWTGDRDGGGRQLRFADDSMAHAPTGELVPLRMGGTLQVWRLRPPPLVTPRHERSVSATAAARRLQSEARDRLWAG